MMTEPAINRLTSIAFGILQVGALLQVFISGLFLLYLLYLYLADTTQQKNTVRRNVPVIGRFRSLLNISGIITVVITALVTRSGLRKFELRFLQGTTCRPLVRRLREGG